MTEHHSRKKGHAGETIAVSAGLAAIAAATYYFWGPKGAKHRRQVKSWSIKMRGEVVEKLEKLKDVSEPAYHQIVDAIAAKYVRQEGAARADIEALAHDLKKGWRAITASIAPKGTKKRASSRAKKTGTSAARGTKQGNGK